MTKSFSPVAAIPPRDRLAQPDDNSLPLLSKRHEAAQALQLSQRKLDQMIASGELPVVRFGKAVRIYRDDLLAIISARRNI